MMTVNPKTAIYSLSDMVGGNVRSQQEQDPVVPKLKMVTCQRPYHA